MILKLFALSCLFASSFAWLAPPRCAKSNEVRDSSPLPGVIHAKTVSNIDQIATKQHEDLIETYKNHEFLGVPIRAKFTGDTNTFPPTQIEVHAPHNCTFHTYDPQLLSSVACDNLACKLSHTVSTVETYTSSEGFNWGVKISSKLSLFSKTFEVGGEASTGKTYTCTFTKGKTTTDLVECSDSSGKSGHIRLYDVKSDMACSFGGVTLQADYRDNRSYYANVSGTEFTEAELDELMDSAQVKIEFRTIFIIDTDKVSDYLLQKMLDKVPLYKPYTDLIIVLPNNEFIVVYLKKTTAVPGYRRVIPFTNEGGNSVYQYACIKVPF